MTKYIGEVFFDPVKENLYQIFSQYFGNPPMTKIKNIDDTYSMYIVKINASLAIEYRYIIAFVNKNKDEIGSKKLLHELNWISLQTRTLQDEHKVDVHSYISRMFQPLNKPIFLIKKDSNQYVYSVTDYPISVVILPKKNIENEYSDKGSLINALETYQTIVTMKN